MRRCIRELGERERHWKREKEGEWRREKEIHELVEIVLVRGPGFTRGVG